MGPLADCRRPRDRVAPGRRVALWAHDHHALLVIARGAADRRARPRTRRTRPAASSGRDATARRPACSTRPPRALVTVHIPLIAARGPRTRDRGRRARAPVARRRRLHDPGGVDARSRPRRARSRRTPACPRRAACRSASTPRSGTTPSRPPSRGGLRSGDILGADPDGRARVGWLKCFADGSLGSRTAALLADIEPEPDRPLAAGPAPGVWMTEPERARASSSTAPRPAGSRPRSTRSATPRSGPRSTSLEPTAAAAAVHAPHRARSS